MQQMWKLVSKFKEKCLMFLLVIKKRSDEGEDNILGSNENDENND